MTTHQRVALVTGAARGQGWAIVNGCAPTGSASRPAMSAPRTRTAVDGLRDDAVIAIPLDVTSPSEWQQAVATTVERSDR